jgi:uncharacterized membrane protein
MFTLTIQVESIAELESFVASLRHSAPPRLVAEVAAAVETQTDIHLPDAPAAAPKPRGRPKKSTPAATDAGEPAAAAHSLTGTSDAQAEPPASTPAEPTLDLARAALQSALGAHGMETAMGVLKQFNAQRITEVPAADYGKFIAACQAA